MARFDGRLAFVTGGGSGIGLEFARLAAARGMKVAIADIDRDRAAAAASEFGDDGLAVAMNVGDADDWARARAEVTDRFGLTVDLLMNAAAMTPALLPLVEMSPDQFDARIRANLSSIFYAARTFGPDMCAARHGHIVNVSSEAGIIPVRMLGDYGTAKFGVVGISGILRIELADFDVGVTVVCPGLTETRMTVGIGGMQPRYVAKAAIEGADENAAFVITHPSCITNIERQYDAIRAAIREPAEPGYVNPDSHWAN